ncbi:pyridoxamine 5'-phosphate oxidase family protein, partial [Acinetobacter baumannii]
TDTSSDTLKSGDFTETDEPFRLFAAWMKEAEASEPNDPNAMALATVDADGLPDVRMVLLKEADETGFVFYTNTQSAKG